MKFGGSGGLYPTETVTSNIPHWRYTMTYEEFLIWTMACMLAIPVPLGSLCPFGPSGLGPVDTSSSINMCPLDQSGTITPSFDQPEPPQSGSTSVSSPSGTRSDTSALGTITQASQSGTASGVPQSGTASQGSESGAASVISVHSADTPQPGTASGASGGNTVTIRELFEKTRNAEYNADE
jgi:hypothetical protein